MDLDAIPTPYDRFIALEPGERVLDCWYGMAVRVDAWGRAFSTQRNGYGRPVTINTRGGLVVLTNRRLRHYRRAGDLGIYGVGQDARLYFAVPLPTIQNVGITSAMNVGGRRALIGVPIHLLTIRVQGEMQYPAADGSLVGRTQFGDVHFDLDMGVPVQELHDEILAAARAVGSSPGSSGIRTVSPVPDSENSAMQPEPSASTSSAQEEGGSDSWIHFHAENDE